MATITLEKEYGFTLLSAFIMLLQYGILGPFTQSKRAKYMNEEHMKKFDQIHKEEKIEGGKLGYPDFGSGRYSEALNYKDWFLWNCAVRCHHNTMEWIVIAVTNTLIFGVFQPIPAAICGGIWVLLRVIYGANYANGKVGRIEIVMFIHWTVIGFNMAYVFYRLFKELVF